MDNGTDRPFAMSLAFFDGQGRAIHLEPLPVRSLQRAGRSAQFKAGIASRIWAGCTVALRPVGLRRGELPAYCDGIELALNGGDVMHIWDLPSERFGSWAREAVGTLVAAGTLAPTETCAWYLLALPAGEGVPAECVIESPLRLPPVRANTGARPNGATVSVLHPGLDYVDDVPLFITRQALEEAIAFCRTDPAVERGGVFLGRLYADQTGAFVLSQTFAPAWDAPTEIARMRFDRATWERIHQQRAATSEHDLDVVAWLHSHPQQQDENEKDARPVLAPSPQDVAIHAAFFPDPHLACVIVDPVSEGHANATVVWGWDRYGVTLQPRTLFLFGGEHG